MLSVRIRRIAALTLAAYVAALGTHCASLLPTEYSELEAAGPEVPPAPENFERIRVTLLEFRNAANIGQFDVIPDGDYNEYTINQRANPQTEAPVYGVTPDQQRRNETSSDVFSPDTVPGGESDKPPSTEESSEPNTPAPPKPPAPEKASEESAQEESDKESEPVDTTGDATNDSSDENKKPLPEVEQVDTGTLAREVTETTLFQSGRFEIVPDYIFKSKVREAKERGLDEAAAVRAASEELGVRYIFYGSLTDFEIRQERDFWKVPLWVIILAASFFIQDRELRNFVWGAMIRLVFLVPLNSEFWDYGVEWDNLDMDIDVAMDLRMVDASSGSVLYAGAKTVTRTENVRNLNLLVWQSDRRIKITKSSAGRQIRYVAKELVVDVADFVDREAGVVP